MSASKGWKMVRLGDVAKTSSGGTPKRGIAEYYSGDIPWVKSGELGDGTVYDVQESITQSGLDNSSAKLFPKGTLCIALYGATIGKLGVLGVDATTNQAVCGIFLPQDIDTQYVFYFLASIRRDLIEQGKGGAQPNINQGIIRDIQIPMPKTAEEQRQIVAEIEKQFTRLDAGVAGLKRVQANLKRYRAAVLKAACEGKLVPTEAELSKGRDASPQASARSHRSGLAAGSESQPYPFESGEQLLERILIERRKAHEEQQKNAPLNPPSPRLRRTKKKYKEPAAPDMKDLPELPEGWALSNIDQLGDVGTGATPKRGNAEYYENGNIPWVTSGALNDEYIQNALEFVTEEAMAKTNLTLYPAGTLLVAMYGEGKTRGKCAETTIATTTNQAIAAIQCSNEIRPYLKVVLWAKYEEMRRFASGGVQPNLNLSLVRAITIPLPPLAEQKRIVEEVERRLSVIDEIETAVAANLKRAVRLRQSILKKAFEGKLA